MKPHINRDKLEEYVLENPSFKLYEKDEFIELHFFPNAPEAQAHFPDGQPVEHIMYGEIIDDDIYFYKFETNSSLGKTETEILDDDPIMEWLKYI